MNYSELKSQLQTLGFTDEAEIEEFAEVIPNAVNQAITTINNNEIAPIIAKYEFELTDEDTGLVYIDMNNVPPEEGEEESPVQNFVEFADETPVLIKQGDTDLYVRFNDFEIETDSIIIIDADAHKGKFRVFYRQAHTPFTYIEKVEEGETGYEEWLAQEEREIQLPKIAHHLLPLLSAYYVWLDDEQVKAIYYYNQYELLVNELRAKRMRPRGRILAGGI